VQPVEFDGAGSLGAEVGHDGVSSGRGGGVPGAATVAAARTGVIVIREFPKPAARSGMARTIGFTSSDTARVRFGRSCLWEVLASLRVLREPAHHGVHLPWVRLVRPRLAAELGAGAAPGLRAGFALLGDLVGSGNHGDYAPDLLTPPPTSLEPSIESELADLAGTPDDVVRRQLDLLRGRWNPALQAMWDDPAGHLGILTEVIGRYWRATLAPFWAPITAVAEAEVFLRGRQQAAHGLAVVLNDLHDRVGWDGANLEVSGTACWGRRELDGGGLCLVPSVFVWPGVLVVADGRIAQLAYPCRGAGTVWDGGFPASPALEQVLGRSKARLLAVLETPASTTDAAGRVRLSVSATSEHLTALSAAGLVRARRSGRSILHVRTAMADALLAGAG
jgi:hypothetical protein